MPKYIIVGIFFSQLRKAIIDHISDSFLDTTVPLLVLTEAAKNGKEQEIKEYAAIFQEHTYRLFEVSLIKCTILSLHVFFFLSTYSVLKAASVTKFQETAVLFF